MQRIFLVKIFAFAAVLLLSKLDLTEGSVEIFSDSLNNVDTDDQIFTTEISSALASEIENEIENLNIKASNASAVKEDTLFLLPHSSKPLHYKLEILPLLFPVEDNKSPYYNVSRFNAPGKVWIRLVCLETTSNITLHAYQDMKIEQEKIKVSDAQAGTVIPIKNVTRDNDTDFLVIHLSHPIGSETGVQKTYEVYIEFIARIGDDRLNGLYLDYYVDPDTKEKRYLSTTLFAPNHARKAFPCFDEPGFKANFSITIGRKTGSGYSSISNMPIISTKPIPEVNGWVWDSFEDTIPLPTYLVAMITTDFTHKSLKDGDLELKLHAPEFLIRRITTLNSSSYKEGNSSKTQNPYLLQDPLRFTAALLRMWQGTKLGSFPLPKVDIIALPHFFFSAMENMGAITFKYPIILNVENITTTSELLRLSFVAGHEVVHQWFGNMLTPKSWTYVWLKESFSDLFARIFLSEKLNAVYQHEDFLTNELQRAMRFDGGLNTHPLENHVKSAAAVGDIYTDIPYRKGASIMNMARIFLTDRVFVQGLESLFIEKKYSNIDQYDLFNHLEESQRKHKVLQLQGLDENVTITDILNSWTQQSSYPIIRVRKEGSKLILKQTKFENGLHVRFKANDSNATGTSTREENSTNSDGYWWVPVTFYKYVTVSSTRQYTIQWLPPNGAETEFPLKEFHSFTNVEGYFRILYGKQELHEILKDMLRKYASGRFGAYVHSMDDTRFLQPLERSQLLDDYFVFAFSQYEDVPIRLLFHILSIMMPNEPDLVVWRTFFDNIEKPYKLFQATKHYPSLQIYLRELLRPLHAFLTSQKPSINSANCFHASTVTRRMYFSQFSATVLSWICVLDADTCSDMAKKAVQTFISTEDIATIPADEQQTMYCAAVKYASDEELNLLWTFFEKMYFQEYYPVQRDRYLKALSCTKKRDKLLRLLNWSTNTTLDFHDVDRVTLLKYIIANPEGREIIWDFLDSNFNALYKSVSVANPVTEAVKAMVEYTNSDEQVKKMEAFINSHIEAMEKKKKFLEKQVKNAKLNVLWMDTFASEVQESIENYGQNTANTKPTCSYESIPDFEEYIGKLADWAEM